MSNGAAAATPQGRTSRVTGWVQTHGPGLLLAFAASGIAFAVHRRFDTISSLVIAVVAGFVAGNAGIVPTLARPGLATAARKVLRIGVVLLGFRLALGDIADLGARGVVVVVVVVAATFFGTQWLARRLGLSPGLGLLVATGYSICGASAIAAVEPFADAEKEEVAYAVALVTLCGSLSIAVLPAIGHLVGLDAADFGSWAGAAVHDVGQVVATASTDGPDALAAAVVVKLTRVLLLAPLVAALAIAYRRRTAGSATTSKKAPIVPLFVAGFLAAVAVRTSGVLPADVLARLKEAESIAFGAALFAMGAAVDLAKLRRIGPRPLVLGLASWVLVAGVSLGLTVALG